MEDETDLLQDGDAEDEDEEGGDEGQMETSLCMRSMWSEEPAGSSRPH